MPDQTTDPLAFLFSNPTLVNPGSGMNLGVGATSGDLTGAGTDTGGTSFWNDVSQPPPSAAPENSPGGSGGIYTPQTPDYVSAWNTGLGTVQKMLKMAYTPDDSETVKRKPDIFPQTPPDSTTASAEPATAQPTTGSSSDYYKTKEFLRHGQDFVDENDRIVGNAGTVGDYDKSGEVTVRGTEFGEVDNPSRGGYTESGWNRGAWGDAIAGENTEGVALPASVLSKYGDWHQGHFGNDFNSKYDIVVTDPKSGKQVLAPLRDAGPGEKSGAGIDLLWGTRSKLGLPVNSDYQLKYSIIPKGSTKQQEQQQIAGGTADMSGQADFFRKRGDAPITSADDSRLSTVNVGDQNWRVNKEAAPYFQGFLKELAQAGAPVLSSGGWNYRQKVGAKGISEHAFGGAIDVNQIGRNEVTPEFRKWMAANPGVLERAERNWHIYGGERFSDLGHFEWGGVPFAQTRTQGAEPAASRTSGEEVDGHKPIHPTINLSDTDRDGVSLPNSVVKNSIGDFENDPELMNDLLKGYYKVAVQDESGEHSHLAPIVATYGSDMGGDALHLMPKTAQRLNTGGRAKVGYQIFDNSGYPIAIKGYHPDTLNRTNWDDHIGPNRKIAGTGPGKRFSFQKYNVPVAEGGYLKPDGTTDLQLADADKAADQNLRALI